MSIGFVNKKPKLQEKDITITENGTQTITPDTGKDGLSSVEITTNVSGGGGSVVENDVNFYDYDGTLVDSYSAEDFLQLSAMPENPSHTGLVAQGWNWDLADAKDYVTEYGILDIGQNYTTASGLSEFDIELTVPTGLTVTLNMNGTKNWGDGTSDNLTTHTYSNVGKYTITCDGDTMNTSSSGGLFGNTQSTNTTVYFLLNVRLANVTKITNYAFCNCKKVKAISICNGITQILEYGFNGFTMFDGIIILPKTFNSMGKSTFSYSDIKRIAISKGIQSWSENILQSSRFEKVIIPSGVTYLYSSCMYSCSATKKISIPKTITYIASNSFYNNVSVLEFNFAKFNSIPTLQRADAFSNMNKLCKIIVPDSLYETWIAATNWVTYADYIVRESDYNA